MSSIFWIFLCRNSPLTKAIDFSSFQLKTTRTIIVLYLNHITYRSSHQRCSVQKCFLEISQNSQENTCEFCEVSKNTFFTEHLWMTASVHISKPFHHACCWRINKLWPSMKTLLLLLTKSPNARKSCLFVCFLSFFRFRFLAYWDLYCKFAGFDSLKPIKKY